MRQMNIRHDGGEKDTAPRTPEWYEKPEKLFLIRGKRSQKGKLYKRNWLFFRERRSPQQGEEKSSRGRRCRNTPGKKGSTGPGSPLFPERLKEFIRNLNGKEKCAQG